MSRLYKLAHISYIKRKRDEGIDIKDMVDEFNLRFNKHISASQLRRLGIRYGLYEADGEFKGTHEPNEPFTVKPMKSGKGKVTMYIKNAEGKWVNYANWLWENSNGKIPDGHLIVFADDDRTNVTLGNLYLVSKKVLGYIRAKSLAWHDRESLDVCVNIAKLALAAGTARNKKR